MNRFMQIYYNAVFGALGGLIGWFIVGSFATGEWNVYLAYTFVGAGVGACIGLMTGAVSGMIVQRSLPRAIIGAILGSIAGFISGILGLLIGEVFFLVIGGGLIGRALGWTLLGLFLGMGDGLINLKLKRAGYGAIGGIVAGVLGGLMYETMTQMFLTTSDTIQIIVGALGVILIGACLGGIIPLSIELIGTIVGKATLVVMNGKRQGLTISVIDTTTLGSSDACEVYLPMDPGIAKKHAVVYQGKDGFYARELEAGNGSFVNTTPIPKQAPGYKLKPGDQIRLGQTIVAFK